MTELKHITTVRKRIESINSCNTNDIRTINIQPLKDEIRSRQMTLNVNKPLEKKMPKPKTIYSAITVVTAAPT